MKLINLCLIILFFALADCKESQYSTTVIQQTNKVELDIYDSFWFTRTKKLTHAMVGDVNIVIKGRTNADRLTVRTYGDGIIGDLQINLDTNGVFNDTILDFVRKAKNKRQNWTFYSIPTSKNIFLPLSSLAFMSFNLLQN